MTDIFNIMKPNYDISNIHTPFWFKKVKEKRDFHIYASVS